MSLHAIIWAWKVPVESATQRILLLALADHADAAGLCYPSHERLAGMCHLTPRSIGRILTELVTKGLVSIQRRQGFRQTSLYRLVTLQPRDQEAVANAPHNAAEFQPDTESGRSPEIPDTESDRFGPRPDSDDKPDRTLTTNRPDTESDEPINEPPKEDPSKNPPISSPAERPQLTLLAEVATIPKPKHPTDDEIAIGFAEFWKAYPTKAGKDLAERNFFRAAKGNLPEKSPSKVKTHKPVPLQDMIDGARFERKKAEADPRAPIMNAQGWLTARRWRDYEDGGMPEIRKRDSGRKPHALDWAVTEMENRFGGKLRGRE